MDWLEKCHHLGECLRDLAVSDDGGRGLQPDRGFEMWLERTIEIGRSGGTVFFIGNGASASMASHFATDLAKTAYIRTRTFFDLSLLTAVGNDLCFEEVFSSPLRTFMAGGDMLVAISSSGESPNILRGVKQALEMGGYVVTHSAMSPENRLRKMGMINFYVSAKTYGLAESSHGAILHHWVDQVAERCPRPPQPLERAYGSIQD